MLVCSGELALHGAGQIEGDAIANNAHFCSNAHYNECRFSSDNYALFIGREGGHFTQTRRAGKLSKGERNERRS